MAKKLPGLSRQAPDAARPVSASTRSQPPKTVVKAKSATAQAKSAQTKKVAAPKKVSGPARKNAANSKQNTKPDKAPSGKQQKTSAVPSPQSTTSSQLIPTSHTDTGMTQDHDTVAQRAVGAQNIVNRYANWATVGGLLPVPIIDAAAVMAVQLKMLGELSRHYGIPFKKNRAKALISSLLGGVAPYMVGAGLGASLAKTLPVVGWTAGLGAIALLSRISTRAVGLVFIQHFESGGTFLDFDPVKSQSEFQTILETQHAKEKTPRAKR